MVKETKQMNIYTVAYSIPSMEPNRYLEDYAANTPEQAIEYCKEHKPTSYLHIATLTGSYTPSEEPMGNCYRVFIGNNTIAIVKTAQAAENLIWMFQRLNHPAPTMRYELTFIDGIGF
jgi:hypothetical protein